MLVGRHPLEMDVVFYFLQNEIEFFQEMEQLHGVSQLEAAQVLGFEVLLLERLEHSLEVGGVNTMQSAKDLDLVLRVKAAINCLHLCDDLAEQIPESLVVPLHRSKGMHEVGYGLTAITQVLEVRDPWQNVLLYLLPEDD